MRVLVSSVMSGGVIALAGTDEQRQEWLPRIAGGEVVLTPAWLEPGRGFGPEGVQVRAERVGDGRIRDDVLWQRRAFPRASPRSSRKH